MSNRAATTGLIVFNEPSQLTSIGNFPIEESGATNAEDSDSFGPAPEDPTKGAPPVSFESESEAPNTS